MVHESRERNGGKERKKKGHREHRFGRSCSIHKYLRPGGREEREKRGKEKKKGERNESQDPSPKGKTGAAKGGKKDAGKRLLWISLTARSREKTKTARDGTQEQARDHFILVYPL